MINNLVGNINSQVPCSSVKNRKQCAVRPECKWTGLADGYCSDRQTWTPSDDRDKPASGCKAVLNKEGCETWRLCSWDEETKKCKEVPAPPTPKPTKAVPTEEPTPKPTMKPSAEPTSSPIIPRRCSEFKTKGSCCGTTVAGKPCENQFVPPPGCYWNGSKCLPKAA